MGFNMLKKSNIYIYNIIVYRCQSWFRQAQTKLVSDRLNQHVSDRLNQHVSDRLNQHVSDMLNQHASHRLSQLTSLLPELVEGSLSKGACRRELVEGYHSISFL